MSETIRLPVKAAMIRHEDGSYSIDEENSEYAEIEADALAGLLMSEFQRQRRNDNERDLFSVRELGKP